MFNELYAKPHRPVLIDQLGPTITVPFTYDQAATDHIGRPMPRVVTKTLTVKFEPLKLELVSTGGTYGSKQLTLRDHKIAFLDESTLCDASQDFLADFLFSDKRLLR